VLLAIGKFGIDSFVTNSSGKKSDVVMLTTSVVQWLICSCWEWKIVWLDQLLSQIKDYKIGIICCFYPTKHTTLGIKIKDRLCKNWLNVAESQAVCISTCGLLY